MRSGKYGEAASERGQGGGEAGRRGERALEGTSGAQGPEEAHAAPGASPRHVGCHSPKPEPGHTVC